MKQASVIFAFLMIIPSAYSMCQREEGDLFVARDFGSGYEFVHGIDSIAMIFEEAYKEDSLAFGNDFYLVESAGVHFLCGRGNTTDANVTFAVELEYSGNDGVDELWLTTSRGGTKIVVTCKATNCTANKCDPVIEDGSATDCQPPCESPATCEKTSTLETTTTDWWAYGLAIIVALLGIPSWSW